MNKSKIALGILCAVVTAALAYNQVQSPEQVKQDLNGEGIGSNGVSTLKVNTDNAAPLLDSTKNTSQLKVQSRSAQNVNVNNTVKSHTNRNYLPTDHEQPADHSRARQPEHHGHEHAQQRRRPEDNSIIPPGEPQKPLPEEQGRK